MAFVQKILLQCNHAKDFDQSVGLINTYHGRRPGTIEFIQQCIYAVTEKKKQQAGEYEPTISVSTKSLDHKIKIVKDNGLGIPQNVKDKIFQPFFTTKLQVKNRPGYL